MTYAKELREKTIQKDVGNLKSAIEQEKLYNRRFHMILLEEETDVKITWRLFWPKYELIGYGKAMWDECIRLGFTPRFSSGGWGGPAIFIHW